MAFASEIAELASDSLARTQIRAEGPTVIASLTMHSDLIEKALPKFIELALRQTPAFSIYFGPLNCGLIC